MISNHQLKIYRSLKQKKYRKKENKFLIEGFNLCEAVLDSPWTVELMLISKKLSNEASFSKFQKMLSKKKVPFEIVAESVTNSLSESVTPQGICAIVKLQNQSIKDFWKLNAQEILILDQVKDPGNLGTILRTADWFGIQAVICTDHCVDIHNGKVLRSSAGSVFHLPLVLNDINLQEILTKLIKESYHIFMASSSSTNSYLGTKYPRPFAIVIGSEREGVQKEVKNFPINEICIPRRGKAESLNVGVATSILLAESFRNVN
jgi:TrmH family RNA methyltransferase